jgi:hypothetical protein
MSRYWFARVGRGRFTGAMVPVTREGKLLSWGLTIALLACWGGLTVAGRVYDADWSIRWAILGAGALLLAGYTYLAFGPKGDRKNTEADYLAGRVPNDATETE